MIPEISARISDVHDELKKLLSHLDEFPDPDQVSQIKGSGAWASRPFHVEYRNLAEVASKATVAMMEELAKMDGAVRRALDDLSEQDAELAASAQRFESFLDDAAAKAAEPTPATDPATPSTASSASRTDMGKYGQEAV